MFVGREDEEGADAGEEDTRLWKRRVAVAAPGADADQAQRRRDDNGSQVRNCSRVSQERVDHDTGSAVRDDQQQQHPERAPPAASVQLLDEEQRRNQDQIVEG